MVVALLSIHGLAATSQKAPPLALQALTDETFDIFVGSAGLGIVDVAIAACHRAGFSLRFGQQALRIASTLGLVSAGLGVALFHASIQGVLVEGVKYRKLRSRDRPLLVLKLGVRRGGLSVLFRNFFGPVQCITREEQLNGLVPS